MRSVAFPALSTGVYGFPPDRAAAIAVKALRDRPAAGGTLERIIFCCFDSATAAIYRRLLAASPS